MIEHIEEQPRGKIDAHLGIKCSVDHSGSENFERIARLRHEAVDQTHFQRTTYVGRAELVDVDLVELGDRVETS